MFCLEHRDSCCFLVGCQSDAHIGYSLYYFSPHVVMDVKAERIAFIDADVRQREPVLVEVNTVAHDTAVGCREPAADGVATIYARR